MPLFSPPIIIQADIRKPNNIKKPVVTQNDSVVLQIEVFENKNPFDLSGAVTVSLASVRKDGVVVTTPGTAVGNVATFNLGTNEVAVTGEVKAKAQFYDADGRISTLSFAYLVEQDPTGSGFVPSVDEETLIEFVMNNAQQKIDELSAVDVVELTAQVAKIVKPGSNGYVSYKMFGAKGDGETNDYESILACHEFANLNGLDVINSGGDYYLQNTQIIPIKTNLLFHNGGFVLDDNSFKDKSYTFQIIEDNFDEDVTTTLSNVFDTTSTVTDNYKNKTFTVRFNNDNLTFDINDEYKRLGFISHANNEKCSFPLEGYENLVNESVTITFKHTSGNNIMLSGFSITYNTTSYKKFLLIRHDNVTVKDIDISLTNISVPNGTLIDCANCYNFVMDNVSVIDTLEFSETYGYLIQLNWVCKTLIRNLRTSMPWRSLGTNYINNFKMENCHTERFDCHFMQTGEIILKDCVFTKQCEIGYGFGITTFENCTFEDGEAIIYRLTPNTAVYYGDIYINNSIAKGYLLSLKNYGSNTSGLSGYLLTYNGQGDFYINHCKATYMVYGRNNKSTYFTRKNRITISNCETVETAGDIANDGVSVKCLNCKNIILGNLSGNTFCDGGNIRILSRFLSGSPTQNFFSKNLYAINATVDESVVSARGIMVLNNCAYKSTLGSVSYGTRVMNNCNGTLPISGVGIFVSGGYFSSKLGYSNTGAGVITSIFISGLSLELSNNTRIHKINVIDSNGTLLNAAGNQPYTYPDLSWVSEL